MTLEEFIEEQRETVNRFYRYWQENQRGPDGHHFPNELEPGEWDEQWRAFEMWS